MNEDLWSHERSLWTGGVEVYRRLLRDDDVAMVFGLPGGPLDRDAVLASIEQAPRWREVSLDERRTLDAEGVRFLIYTATATGDAPAPYRAACASAWIDTDAGPRLVFHQQTPLGD